MKSLAFLAVSLLLCAAAPAGDMPSAAAQPPVVHVKDTPEARARVHAHFHAVDADGDGAITSAELESFAKRVCKTAKARSCEDVLKKLKAESAGDDADHDGKVTEAEYDAHEEPLEK